MAAFAESLATLGKSLATFAKSLAMFAESSATFARLHPQNGQGPDTWHVAGSWNVTDIKFNSSR